MTMPRPHDLNPLAAIADLAKKVDALAQQLDLLKHDLAQRDAQIIGAYTDFTKASLLLADGVAARCLESDSYSVQAREELRRQREAIHAMNETLPTRTATATALAVGAAISAAVGVSIAPIPEAATADLAG